MNTNTTPRSRAIEYSIAGCLAVAMLFGVFHLVRRNVAIHERVEEVATGCRPLVVEQAKRLADRYPGLKWSIDDIHVLGDIKPDQPMSNACSVSITFDVGGHADHELWEVGAIAGQFVIGSARFAGVETIQ